MAIIALIVTPLVMNIIRKAKISARKRSVDAYGRSVELAIAGYLLDTGTFPTDLHNLTVEYSGQTVVCNVMQMKENGGLYMSECTVNNIDVKDSSTDDGWYHYGERDLTNEEYVNMYGDALKSASLAYYTANNQAVSDYTTLTVDYKGKPVSCDVTVNYDGTIYMTNCKVNNISVTSENEEDGYYHYGSIVNPPSAVNDLLAKANGASVTSYSAGNTGEMYTFTHPATIQQNYEVTDYRYIGANPKNYVTFNNELWRIIGVFTVEDGNGNQEQRIKIVRNEKLSSSMKWDSNGENEWSTATLNTYLNGDYYNGLEATSKSMVADTKYYLGGSSTYDNLKGEDYYNFERGETTYQNSRQTNWTGKIALMYPSDYSYTYALGVDNTCYTDGTYNGCGQSSGKTNGWIYNTNSNSTEWLLSPRSVYGFSAFLLGDSGCVSGNNGVTTSSGVRPSLYLISDIKIDSGEGTEQSPYQLKL